MCFFLFHVLEFPFCACVSFPGLVVLMLLFRFRFFPVSICFGFAPASLHAFLVPGFGHGIDQWPEPPAVPTEFVVSELSSPVKPGTARTTNISNASSATILSDDMPFTDQPNMPPRTRL